MRKLTDNAREISEAKLVELKKDAMTILSNVRRTMMQRQPFTGSVAMNLEIVPVRDLRCETACTDGKHVFFDIDFLSSLNPEERLFVFSHEVWHNLMMHFARTENRDHELMNIATDLEVNQILVKEGMCIPKDCLMPAKFGFPSDLAAEAYYELLVKNGNKPQNGSTLDKQFDKHIYSGQSGDGQGQSGDGQGQSQSGDGQGQSQQGQDVSDKYGKVGFDPDFTPGNPKDAVERIRESAVAASQVYERTRGSLPGHIKGLVEALLKPEINWREQLQQFVTRSCGGENRSWNPPNRRHIHSGTYLQSRKGEKIRIVAGLDVSGSTSRDIPKFLGELNGLVQSFGKYELTVMQCDTEVKRCDTYSDDEPLDLENEKFETVGGGGTILKPIFDKIEELADENGKPDAIIILTDGFCEHFTEDDDPGIPVMWLVTNGGKKDIADFGDVTEFKERS